MWGNKSMTIRQYLIRSINVLNLILFAAVAMVFFYVLEPLLQASTAVKIPVAKETPVVSSKDGERHQVMVNNDAVIGDKNLFHPDRIIPPEKKTAVALVRPDIVLHGTMITDQIKLAYVEDKKAPSTSSGRGTRQITLKEGDLIGGYKLKQITDKMVLLTNGEEQMTLYLDELKDRKTETTGTAKTGGPTPPTAAQTPSRPSMPLPASAPVPAPTLVNPAASPRGINRQSGQGASMESPRGAAIPPPPILPRIPGSR
jgi:type II secretory pathway component PulC